MDKVELIYGKQEKRKIECNHLKPCPFCNGEAVLSGLYPLGQYYIQCLECRVSLWDDREDKAVGHWNMRGGESSF